MVNVRRSVPADLPGLMRVERRVSRTVERGTVLSFPERPEHRRDTATDDREAKSSGIWHFNTLTTKRNCAISPSCPREGGGIGALLIDTAVDFAPANPSVFFIWSPGEYAPAIALYRRKGFCPVGTTERLLRGQRRGRVPLFESST